MSTTVLLGITSFEKNWGPVDFGGASNFSNLLAPWASGSRSLMLRAEPNQSYNQIGATTESMLQPNPCYNRIGVTTESMLQPNPSYNQIGVTTESVL